jgi:predicted RNA-binding Zn-ribbon protein involved in translation (DUF1610 family)
MAMKKSRKEKHSSVCDSCGERLDTPYLSDMLDWIEDSDIQPNVAEDDVRIRCPNCPEGWVWLRLRVEPID